MNRSAFTTIEIIVASTIIAILSIGVLSLQYLLTTNQLTTINSYLNVDQTNASIASLIRELREARNSDAGAHPLVTLEDNQIIFYSDIDYDGDVERVRYTLTSQTLEKGVINPTGFPITYPVESERVFIITEYITNISDPLFTYFNQDWPEDTINNPLPEVNRLSDTRLIRILINLNTNPNYQKQEYVLESFVNLRSLKRNL